MTISIIILCLIAGISLAKAQQYKYELNKQLFLNNKLNITNTYLKHQLDTSEVINEADENETWG